MSEEKDKKKQQFHISPQLSRTYFSYKKPSDTGYSFMFLSYFNDRVKLHFKRAITSENVLDLDCFLSDAKAYDISRLLEGIMARRRDAYLEGKNYDCDEIIKCPTTSFRDGKEVQTGLLMIDTEMFDGIPRIRVSYTSTEKNDTIEVVFNSRVPNGPIETRLKENYIDYADIMAFDFVNTFKEIQNPLVPIIYRIQDSAASSITRYISAIFSNNGGNRNNNTPIQQTRIDDDYDSF